jgi:uncharacterized protein
VTPGIAGAVFRTDAGRLRLGWRLVLFLVTAAAVAVAVGLVLPASMLAGSAAMLTGSVMAGWLLLAQDGRPPAALGFHLGREGWSEAGGGIGVGAAVALAAVGLMTLAGAATWASEPGTLAGWIGAGASALLFLALPAAAEEALVRGYPLQALAEVWGVRWALVTTSAVFGLLHLGNPGVTPLAALNVALAGLWLGVVYVRTGSLWWATGAHLGWNWAGAFLADLPVSGLELFDAPFYDGVTRGPGWLGGGAFGPEGSVAATALLAAAAWLCWRARWLKPSAPVMAAGPLVTDGRGTIESDERRKERGVR